MIMRRTTLWPLIASLAVLAVGLLWAFWPILVAMAERWSNDPQYAHGYLVPVLLTLDFFAPCANSWVRSKHEQ